MKLCNALPKISIVTPSYNQGQYIENTILSILDQKYPKIEYIIIDGGSTDNSVQIIKKYERHLAYWISEKDRGQTYAINKGFERSTGDVLAYLNSDDLYLADTLHFVANYFIENPNAKFIYGDVQIIDEKGSVIKEKKQPNFDYVMGCMIGFGLLIDQPAAFWRREVYENIGPLNEDYTYNMDGEYFYRVSKQYEMIHVEKFLARFRWQPLSKTMGNRKKPSQLYLKELDAVRRDAYSSLRISKIIPFERDAAIRNTYRIKRILIRMFKGHYLLNLKRLLYELSKGLNFK